MTVNVTKPALNIREKLAELDFAKVPYQKMPAGSVLQVVSWEIPPTSISTAGSWVWSTLASPDSTYGVASYTFNKTRTSSHVVAICNGAVDSNSLGAGPTVVALANLDLPQSGGTLGAAYHHVRYANTEPHAFGFSAVDTSTTSSVRFSLRCHSHGASALYFSRFQSGTSNQNPYTITLMEIAQ